ncbi:alkyl hydroperoxide reductase AhpD [Aliidongia dinghuensis]|uniref:Alkyl hydroperoxide reductase AhpD n=1 Tax=Aliidongia dinghuensis TaxID=1867774 RepID=A0A8J2YQL4_9PROT|nr:carboxymuconolactone decarboxylase family protein [Aliidongia dinghuensis]GGF04497.1 alkyl hydroperoxide reductase AhpD [Aliidongia dinghuensis]
MSARLDYNAAAPAGTKALYGVHTYLFKETGFAPSFLELVFLRTSQINGCAYCIDMHTRALVKAGLGIDKLALVLVWREAGDLFDARERAALAWAESVTNVASTGVPDADYVAAATVFNAKELSDLTIAIGLMNAYNRLAISFRAKPTAVP